ncbi:MAG: RDD family protein [Microbacteriaceae bacterium]
MTSVTESDETPGLLPDGTPDPAYAAELGLIRAPLGRRVLSFAIEWFIVAALATIGPVAFTLIILNGDQSLPPNERPGFNVSMVLLVGTGLLAFGFMVSQLILHGRRGVSLGKRLTGIRSVDVATLEAPGFGHVLLRAFLVVASGVVAIGPALMWASAIWDGSARSRAWHDKITRIWLVDARRGLDPYDEKAMRLARKRVAAPKIAAAAEVPSLATGVATSARFTEERRSRSSVVGAAVQPGAAAPGSETSGAPSPVAPPSAPAVVGSPASATPLIAPPPSATPAPVRHHAVLVGDDGVRYDIEAPVLFGRNPTPNADESGVAIRPVSDGSFSMSKTHAKVGVDEHGVWVEDRGSSNGSSVMLPGGEVTIAPPGERVYVAWGATISMGDRAFVVRQS